jgi:glycosyltransferase involved in cell wall biosynthesis
MSRRTAVLELRSVWGTGGGPEKTILLGTARADRAKYDVTVCYLRDERDEVFGIDARAGELDIDYVEIRERHSFDPRIWRTFTALIKERGIDIVHAHDYKTNVLAYAAARRHGVLALSTAHGWTGASARERYLYYPVDQWLLGRFPRVIAVSSDIRNQIVRRGGDESRVSVVLNAIDGAAFCRDPARSPLVRASLGLQPDWIVIGSAGRVERQKRFDLLLDAVAPLAREQPRLHLVVAGDGSLRSALADQADRLGIASQCHWLGHRTDVADVHHAFDLFVQSSEYEGTPNAVLEAMAMGTPIVATDAGGTRELAWPDVHGLIVPTGNAGALREAMRASLADRGAAAHRAEAARRRIETDLSFEARTRRLERIYDEMIAARDREGGRRA